MIAFGKNNDTDNKTKYTMDNVNISKYVLASLSGSLINLKTIFKEKCHVFFVVAEKKSKMLLKRIPHSFFHSFIYFPGLFLSTKVILW